MQQHDCHVPWKTLSMISQILVSLKTMKKRLTTVPDHFGNVRSFDQLIQGRDRRIQTLSRQIDGTCNSASLRR
jgi:hypothetical protein